jgi:hypothetical protein
MRQVDSLAVRLMLGVELDVADEAVVIRLLECCANLLGIGRACAPDRIDDNVDRIVRGAGKLRRILLELRLKLFHERIIDRVVDGVDVLDEPVDTVGGRPGELQVAVARP